MAWVKLDDQFPLNAKTRSVSVEARYLFVTSLCWCAMQMNDGTFPASDLPAVAVLADVPPNVVEQLIPAFWHPEGTTCEPCADAGQVIPVPAGHYMLHCYLERNESRSQVEERRRKDRQRKTRSGMESGRNPPVSSRPVLTSDPSSSRPRNSRDGTAASTDDGQISTTVPDECWDRYAELKLETELRRHQINGNHTRWKATTRRNAQQELGDTAARWYTDFDVTPRQLAEWLIDGQPNPVTQRRKPT